METNRYWIRILCVVVLLISGCNPTEEEEAPAVVASVANPAAVACVKGGGRSTMTQTPQGEVGMCQLRSGKVCEEWAWFRGDCS